MSVELSFCVVNTGQRELLLRGLDAIAREASSLPFVTEVVVVDNASDDGSADAARAHPARPRVVARSDRAGWSENVNLAAERSSGRYVLLLNEDAELQPGAAAALHAALEADERAAVAAAALYRPDGAQQPSSWRFPTPWTALLTLLGLHRRLVVQSRGEQTRAVDWSQSCAMLLRRSALDAVGWWDAGFFVYSEEVDVQRRLADAGWCSLYVPAARAYHHEQLSTGALPHRRIVEFSRNRDRYMRKHHSAVTAMAVRLLTAAAYAQRALAAVVLPGHDPRRYWAHVRATLTPGRGEGMREAAAEFNAKRGTDL